MKLVKDNTKSAEPSSAMSLFDMYFQLVDNSSESPFLYHRWTLISAVSALLGRKAHLKFGFDVIHPNMYICLMGNAGTRKSSAIAITRKLMEQAGYEKFARERSSKEKFIEDLGTGFDVINGHRKVDPNAEIMEISDTNWDLLPPSEVYICAGELEDFLGQNDGSFISLLTNMWDNLPHYGHGKIAKDIWVKEPTVNLIGGCTPITFNTVFPPEVIGQGMLSRLLIIYGAGVRRKITIPKRPDGELLKFFEDHMKTIHTSVSGEFTLSEGAYRVLDDVYQTDLNLQDSRMETYITRRHIHYLKLCMVIAAMNLTNTITEEIAIEANTILHYTERLMPKALGEFGKSFKSDNVAMVMEVLTNEYRNTGKGMTLDELFRRVNTYFDSFSKDFGEVIAKLKSADKIKANGMLVVPNFDLSITQLPHVDFNLLREYREDHIPTNLEI